MIWKATVASVKQQRESHQLYTSVENVVATAFIQIFDFIS